MVGVFIIGGLSKMLNEKGGLDRRSINEGIKLNSDEAMKKRVTKG